MKKIIYLLMLCSLFTIKLSAETKSDLKDLNIKLNIPKNIENAYQIQKNKKMTLAVFKKSLNVVFKNKIKVISSVMTRGMEIALKHSKKDDLLGAGIVFKDKVVLAYYVKRSDLIALKIKKMSRKVFAKRIRIKWFNRRNN